MKRVHAELSGGSAVEKIKLRDLLIRNDFITGETAVNAPHEAAALPKVPTMMSTAS